MSDIQEALDKADNYNPNSVLGRLTKTLAAAYRKKCAELEEKTIGCKAWAKTAQSLQKELAAVKAERDKYLARAQGFEECYKNSSEGHEKIVKKYNRLLEVAENQHTAIGELFNAAIQYQDSFTDFLAKLEKARQAEFQFEELQK